MAVKGPHLPDRKVVGEMSIPLVQATARGGRRIMGIHRQQHDFIALSRLEFGDCFRSEGMPVAHGHKATGVDPGLSQLTLQGAGLLLGKPAYRKTTADDRVVVLQLFCPSRGYQLSQRLAPDPGKGKIDNVGITKQVKKKRFNGFQRIGPAELKKNYTNAPC